LTYFRNIGYNISGNTEAKECDDPRLSGVRRKSLSVTADKDFYLLAQLDDANYDCY